MKDQAEAVVDPATVDGESAIGTILSDAVKGSQAAPEVAPEPGSTGKEQSPAPQETLFTKLVLAGQELPFKTREDFDKFIESNQTLKEGFLRRDHHTQKLQELAKQREDFENQRKVFDAGWGERKPDESSMKSLQTLWNVFQTGKPEVSDAIQKFVEDISLISQGQQPISQFFTGKPQATANANQSPEVIALQSKISDLERNLLRFQSSMTEKEKAVQAQREAEDNQKAQEFVDEWLDSKEKSGIKISQKELAVMADLSVLNDPVTGKPYTLDRAHEVARHSLGLTKADVAKEVIQDANNLKKKTGNPPGSKGSASEEPEAKTLGGILKQGAKALAS